MCIISQLIGTSTTLSISLLATPAANADDETVSTKDEDPEGLKLLAVANPLEQASKLLLPLYALRPQLLDTWLVSYDVAVRRGKLVSHQLVPVIFSHLSL